MVDLSTIIKFVEKKTGTNNISENADITNDLGVDGDDFDELITQFSQQFNVDISSCLWYFHASEEGSWNSIGGAFYKSPDKRVTHIPITPLKLYQFAREGKWNIQYPEHQLPKRRYDMILNQLILLLFSILCLYKCAS